MNDYYNTYTINVKSGDIAKTLDALKPLSLMDRNERRPVADLETDVIETVQLSFVTRGLQENKTEFIDSQLKDAGICANVDVEFIDIAEANLAVEEIKDVIQEGLLDAGYMKPDWKVTDKCSVEQMTAICDAEAELDVASRCAQFNKWYQFRESIAATERLIAKAFPNQFPNFVTKLADNERAA